MLKCKKCGFDLNPTWEFCPNCGFEVKKGKEVIRPALKKQIGEGKVVCWNCGKAIPTKGAKDVLERFGNVYCTACGEPQNIDKTELEIRKSLILRENP